MYFYVVTLDFLDAILYIWGATLYFRGATLDLRDRKIEFYVFGVSHWISVMPV